MTELKKILSIYLDLYLHQIIISGARTKEGASKIRIRPVVMKDKLYFQCTSTVGTKEIHENYEKERLLEAIEGWITTDFRQLQLESELGSVNVLSSKKGKLTIKEKKKKSREIFATSRFVWKRCPITGRNDTFWKRENR